MKLQVLVIDAGEVVEFGSPYELLERNGVFKTMVDSTGRGEAENLLKIAKEKNNYES